MNKIGLKISKMILPFVLRRACESRIPRSGEDGAKVNCYITAVDKNSAPYLMVLDLVGDEICCLEWDGSSYQTKRNVHLSSLKLSEFSITHYYGLDSVEFNGFFDFIFSRITTLPYIKIHLVRTLDNISQHIFNKKKFYTKQRMELLKHLVAKALEGNKEHDSLSLMTDLYTLRWYLHPQGRSQRQRVEFYLESLVATGELVLIRSNFKYMVTGLALKTIEEYEEQERKHTENVKTQSRMVWLTLAVVIASAVQAGLIKLPTLLNFTN